MHTTGGRFGWWFFVSLYLCQRRRLSRSLYIEASASLPERTQNSIKPNERRLPLVFRLVSMVLGGVYSSSPARRGESCRENLVHTLAEMVLILRLTKELLALFFHPASSSSFFSSFSSFLEL